MTVNLVGLFKNYVNRTALKQHFLALLPVYCIWDFADIVLIFLFFVETKNQHWKGLQNILTMKMATLEMGLLLRRVRQLTAKLGNQFDDIEIEHVETVKN